MNKTIHCLKKFLSLCFVSVFLCQNVALANSYPNKLAVGSAYDSHSLGNSAQGEIQDALKIAERRDVILHPLERISARLDVEGDAWVIFGDFQKLWDRNRVYGSNVMTLIIGEVAELANNICKKYGGFAQHNVADEVYMLLPKTCSSFKVQKILMEIQSEIAKTYAVKYGFANIAIDGNESAARQVLSSNSSVKIIEKLPVKTGEEVKDGYFILFERNGEEALSALDSICSGINSVSVSLDVDFMTPWLSMGAVRARHVPRNTEEGLMSWSERIIDAASEIQGQAKLSSNTLFKVGTEKDLIPEVKDEAEKTNGTGLFEGEEAVSTQEVAHIKASLTDGEAEKLYPCYKESSLDGVLDRASSGCDELTVYRIDTNYTVLNESMASIFTTAFGTRDSMTSRQNDPMYGFKALETVNGYKAGDDTILLLSLLLQRHFRDSGAKVVRFGADKFYLVFGTKKSTTPLTSEEIFSRMQTVQREFDAKLGKLGVCSNIEITKSQRKLTPDTNRKAEVENIVDEIILASNAKDAGALTTSVVGRIAVRDCARFNGNRTLLDELTQQRRISEAEGREKSKNVLEKLGTQYTTESVLQPQTQKRPVVLLLGYPGAGKTTILEKLAPKLRMPGISTGATIRRFLDGNPEYVVINNESLGFDMLSGKIASGELSSEEGLIFDANPTFPGWKDMFDKFLEDNGLFLSKVVYVKAEKDTVLTRMQNRGRGADTGRMEKRIEDHEAKVEPIIGYFRDTGRLVEFDNSTQYTPADLHILEDRIDELRDELIASMEEGEEPYRDALAVEGFARSLPLPDLNGREKLALASQIQGIARREKEQRGPLDGKTILRFSYGYEGVGGLERHLQQLNQILLERNAVTIVQMYYNESITETNVVKETIGKGKLVRISMPINRGDRSLNIAELGRQLEAVHAQYRIDLAVMHSLVLKDSAVFADEIKKAGIPLVAQNHAANDVLEKTDIAELLSKTQAVAGVSGQDVPEGMRDTFTNLSDAVDMDFFNPALARPLQLSSDRPVIILPARMTPLKGHEDIIRAIKILKDRGQTVKVIFTVDENETGRSASLIKGLKNLALSEGIEDSIIFSGYLSREQMRDYYAASDVVVLPSHTEGLGMVLLEAQAMGKPVITYNVGGVPETLKDKETGYLVAKGNVGAFADKLYELLTDTDRRTTMGQAGRQFIQESFSTATLAERHESFYKRFIKSQAEDADVGKALSDNKDVAAITANAVKVAKAARLREQSENIFEDLGGYTAKDVQRGKELTIRRYRYRDVQLIRIGSRIYEVKGDVKSINLRDLLADPLLWIGNAELVDFFGEDAIQSTERKRGPPSLMLVEVNEELSSYLPEIVQISPDLLNYAYTRLQASSIDSILASHYRLVVYFFGIFAGNELNSELKVLDFDIAAKMNDQCFNDFVFGLLGIRNVYVPNTVPVQFRKFFKALRKVSELCGAEKIVLDSIQLDENAQNVVLNRLSFLLDTLSESEIDQFTSLDDINAKFNKSGQMDLFIYDGESKTLNINLREISKEKRSEDRRTDLEIFRKRGPPIMDRDRVIIDEIANLAQNGSAAVVNRISSVMRNWLQDRAINVVLQGITRNYRIFLPNRDELLDPLKQLPFGAGRGVWVLGGGCVETELWVREVFSEIHGTIKIIAGTSKDGVPIINDQVNFGRNVDRTRDCSGEASIDRFMWRRLRDDLYSTASMTDTELEALQNRYDEAVQRTKNAIKTWISKNGLRVLLFGQVALPEENPIFYPALYEALEELNAGKEQSGKIIAVIRHNYTNRKKSVRPGIKIKTMSKEDFTRGNQGGLSVIVESETNAELFEEYYGFRPSVLHQAIDFPEVDKNSVTPFQQQIRETPKMAGQAIIFTDRIATINAELSASGKKPINLENDIIIIQPSRIDMNKRPDSTILLAKNMQRLENEDAIRTGREPRTVRVLFIGTTIRTGLGDVGLFGNDSEKQAVELVERIKRKTGDNDIDISDQVHFVGYIPQEVVLSALTYADIVSVPSEHETFGRIPVEAVATGVPLLYFRNWLYTALPDDLQVFYRLYGGIRASTLRPGKIEDGVWIPGQAVPNSVGDEIPRMHRDMFDAMNNPALAEEIARSNFIMCRRSMFNLQHIKNFFKLKLLFSLWPENIVFENKISANRSTIELRRSL